MLHIFVTFFSMIGSIRDRCLTYFYLLGRTTKMRNENWNDGLRSEQHFFFFFDGGDSSYSIMKIFPYSMLDGYLVLPNAIPTETKTHICAEIQQTKVNSKSEFSFRTYLLLRYVSLDRGHNFSDLHFINL